MFIDDNTEKSRSLEFRRTIKYKLLLKRGTYNWRVTTRNQFDRQSLKTKRHNRRGRK